MTPQRRALNELIAFAAKDDAEGGEVSDGRNAGTLLARIARAAFQATVLPSPLPEGSSATFDVAALNDLVDTILYVVEGIYGIDWKAEHDGGS